MLAILFDVHGNLPALEAVLADAQEAGADRYLLGGDLAAFGAWPAETVARLRALDPVAIRGNWERWQGGEAPDDEVVHGACRHVVDALGPEVVARHAALPERVVHEGLLVVHASPLGDMDGFSATDPGDDERLLAGEAAPRLVFGHTHVQFTRTTASGVELTNPGSVGLPLDGDPRAAYALVGTGGTLELRRVPYDVEAAAAAVEALGSAWAVRTAARLRAARMDV